MNYLNIAWDKITNNGVDEAALGREVVKIRLLNQLIFIALLTSLLAIITYIFTNEDVIIILITLANVSLEIAGIYFAYKQKHHITRFLACWVFPALVANNVMILGGNFGEVNIFTAAAFMNFIIYEGNKRLQIPIVIYTCVLFILSKLYVINYSTQAIVEKNPYDEIVTFPMIILILGLIILLYQKSLKKYETEQATLINNLEQKNTELQSVNKELEEFTYIASHDLKTPLRTINSYVGLAKRHLSRKDYEATKIDLDFISQGATQMYALVSDILEYKSISNDNEPYEALELNEILANVLQSLEVLMVEQNAEIVTHTFPTIYGRRRDFITIFQNFIENAIKYNESTPPKVELHSILTEEHFHLTIRDNGIGIAPEYHQKIFHFFKRLHTQEKYQGTGIGLGLCKKIINNYNGKITVDSKEGEGTTFNIIFPKTIIIQKVEDEQLTTNMA